MSARSVSQVVKASRTYEGGGFPVQRPFPAGALDEIDPFLLLDEMGPVDYPPGEAKGAPDHPHRGFETVTYVLQGRMEHKDSRGNHGRLGPGDVQWMTAGGGVVHSEMPEQEFLRSGGRMHGFQLWVNLPARDKMMKPRYQDVPAVQIPEAASEDGRVKVRVIAGEALGKKAVIDTRTPILYLHFTLQPGATITQPVPRTFNLFAYVVDGRGTFGQNAEPAGDAEAVLFAADGDSVEMRADASTPLDVLLIGGVPLNEPVARYGPFVMNTREQIMQAFRDFQTGRMGAIDF